MPNVVPAVTAWSYSRYSDYKRCPAFFKYKHLEKRPGETQNAAMARGNDIHKLAEDYTKGAGVGTGGKRAKAPPVPPELVNFKTEFQQLATLNPLVEQEWGFNRDWAWTGRRGWFGDDVWLRAKADVMVVYDDNTGDLIDHKTGKKYQVNEDQVELFALAGFKRFPQLTSIRTRLWYLDIADPTENEVIRDYSAADAARIQKDWEKRVRPMFADRKFAPTPNDKCRWCAYSKAAGGPCIF